MQVVTGILVVAALAIPVASPAQSGSAPSKADIQKLLDERDHARNRGDWRAFAQSFTADATTLSSDGRFYKGHTQIEKGNQDVWGAGAYKGARLKTTVDSVEAVTPDVAGRYDDRDHQHRGRRWQPKRPDGRRAGAVG